MQKNTRIALIPNCELKFGRYTMRLELGCTKSPTLAVPHPQGPNRLSCLYRAPHFPHKGSSEWGPLGLWSLRGPPLLTSGTWREGDLPFLWALGAGWLPPARQGTQGSLPRPGRPPLAPTPAAKPDGIYWKKRGDQLFSIFPEDGAGRGEFKLPAGIRFTPRVSFLSSGEPPSPDLSQGGSPGEVAGGRPSLGPCTRVLGWPPKLRWLPPDSLHVCCLFLFPSGVVEARLFSANEPADPPIKCGLGALFFFSHPSCF